MYGIPDTIDWSFLLGAKVEQIAIGEYDLQIRFFKDICISVQGMFEHLVTGECLSCTPELRIRSTTLVSLLGSKVTKVTTDDHRVLIVAFSNLEVIKVYDSEQHYESFTVTYPGNTIVV
jgi:hypothetical protein